jgi:hypothetical protein
MSAVSAHYPYTEQGAATIMNAQSIGNKAGKLTVWTLGGGNRTDPKRPNNSSPAELTFQQCALLSFAVLKDPDPDGTVIPARSLQWLVTALPVARW